MVTAILIPIICLYFFWLTRKERKEQDREWLEAGNVHDESVITGEIKDISEEKQRFYYHRFIIVQNIKLQTSSKMVTAVKKTPLTPNVKIDTFMQGETIRLYGTWEGSQFVFNKWIIEKR